MTHVIRYIISGISATGITLGALYVFTAYVGVWYPLAAAISYAIGIYVSFHMQKFWTFQNGNLAEVKTQLALYSMVGLVNIILNGLLVYVFVDLILPIFAIPVSGSVLILGAQVIAAALIAVESYLIYRHLIFKPTA